MAVGAETEYIDLFDLSYTGCRSCLACKRKGAERCKCFWKDDLSPVIDRIFAADTLIIGSPIYLGDVTSQVHGLIERLLFCALSYDDYSNYFTGKVNVGSIKRSRKGSRSFSEFLQAITWSRSSALFSCTESAHFFLML